jgi:hypothetical protein
MLMEDLSIATTFDPCYFSLDFTFKSWLVLSSSLVIISRLILVSTSVCKSQAYLKPKSVLGQRLSLVIKSIPSPDGHRTEASLRVQDCPLVQVIPELSGSLQRQP